MSVHRTAMIAAALLLISQGWSSRSNVTPKWWSLWSRVTSRSAHDANSSLQAPRALAIIHACMYDAWVAHDEHGVGTQLSGALRRPPSERTEANKERTISYAAYRALSDLFPANVESTYKPLMRHLGYDPNDRSTDIETPVGIGNVACAAVLEFRYHDGSNQLGDLLLPGKPGDGQRAGKTGPYQDWTGYTTLNPSASIPIHFPFTKPLNPDHWQPLTYIDSSGNLVLQMFSAAHWGQVTPFGLTKGDEFRDELAPPPARFCSPEYEPQARELMDISANLTDRQKMIAEFWTGTSGDANGATGANASPLFESPIEHWLRFAQFISERDHHSLDDDVKMYFALSNAMFDASIAANDAKRTFDSVRPLTAIAFLFHGQKIRAWGGPGKGSVEMDGSDWHPYQPATSPTPPSPEYVSAISAESAAAAEILRFWTGSDQFGYSVTLPKGSSKIEPGITPAQPVTLHWRTFSEAADEAGMAGRYAGIHFAAGDLAGRKLGRLVAAKVWAKAQAYFTGQPAAQTPATADANF